MYQKLFPYTGVIISVPKIRFLYSRSKLTFPPQNTCTKNEWRDRSIMKWLKFIFIALQIYCFQLGAILKWFVICTNVEKDDKNASCPPPHSLKQPPHLPCTFLPTPAHGKLTRPSVALVMRSPCWETSDNRPVLGLTITSF